jgi:hypothetical protein
MKIRKEGTELQDWFEARNQARWDKQLEEERRQAGAYEHQIRQRQAQAAAQERRQFEKKWLTYAVEHKPWNSPADYALIVKPEVTDALAGIETDEDYYTIQRVVDAAISRALEPYRKAEQRREAVEDAIDSLPWSMRCQWNDTDWKAQARIIAATAVARARQDASAKELEAIAKEAVKPLIQKYEHNERVESVVKYLSLPHGTTDDDREAREIVQEALLGLPIDANQRQFEQTKENALEPIRARIAARLQKQRDEAERQALMARINSWVPPELSPAEKGATFAKATEAVATLPASTSDDDREKTAREVIDRQAAKKQLIEEGLAEAPRYAQRLLRNYRYAASETPIGIAQRVTAQVEKELHEELDGNESRRDVIDLVRDIMEDVEGCE